MNARGEWLPVRELGRHFDPEMCVPAKEHYLLAGLVFRADFHGCANLFGDGKVAVRPNTGGNCVQTPSDADARTTIRAVLLEARPDRRAPSLTLESG